MNLLRYVDVNCERTQDGFFGEPFNTLTGLAFFVVAYLLYQQLKKRKDRPFLLKFLIGITAFIGLGSMIFHSTARMWGALFDSLPIAIFAVVYIFAVLRHVIGLRMLMVALVMALFVFANIQFKMHVMRAPDGYISIIPTLGFILLLSLYMGLSRNESWKTFLLITLVCIIAVYVRIQDYDICEQFPIGTHFIWHLLMALAIYLMNYEVIRRYVSKIKP